MTPERWQELKKVLAGALELDPAERSAYLDRVCPEPSVRSEVESLIAAHDKGDSRFLAQSSAELKQGMKLGPYEILAPLGAGGMGEVYRARDTRLDRIVAIKILPEHGADRDGLRERFEREARAVASLNHPHICVLHDVGHQNGIDYLVMEYLEGETLAQRLAKGPLPPDQVLRHAMEIADALDKAHRNGITHRDLKPGNIMLTKSGAKLLDFGLAKWKQEAAGSAPLSLLSTKDPITEQGVILGTLQYMAPEQVEGKEADARTDIFAFGAVVYEMATGKKAFEGKTQASLIAKILETNPPPISSFQPMTPPALDRLVKRCLAKDPEDRWQTARDLWLELKSIIERGPEAAAQPAPVERGRLLRWMLLSAIACLAAAGFTGVAVWHLKPSKQPAEVARTLVNSTPADRFSPPRPTRTAVALSPNGKHLVFSATKGGTQQLYLRDMDRSEGTPIAGTENSNSPFFSPDGQWLGFWQGTVAVGAIGELKKVPLGGGPAVTLCKTGLLYGASWGTDDTVVFASQYDGGLWRVSGGGGTPQPLTTVDTKRGEFGHRLPQMLPGGQAVLFTAIKARYRWDDAQIVVRSLVTNEQKVLIEGAADARYVPTGHLVYVREGTLMAVPFNLERLETTGSPVGILEGVMQDVNTTSSSGDTGAAQFSISDSGSLVYMPGGVADREVSAVWVSRDGKTEPIPIPLRSFLVPRFSPDGQQLVLTSTTGMMTQNVATYGIKRGALSALTTAGQNMMAVWTPDGKRVTFGSSAAGPLNLFWKPADGSGPAERLTTSEHNQRPSSWSPDGKTLAFLEIISDTHADIWTLSLENGVAKTRPLVQSPSLKRWAEFSPDGRWLAYVSNESGRDEVYVQPYPGPGFRLQVSTEGGIEPAWSHSGREMFYVIPNPNGTMKMMAVDVALQPKFTVGRPHLLFEGRFAASTYLRNYDVASDDRRFIMIQAKEQAQEPSLTEMFLVQNWFEELKQKVPTGRK